MSGCEVLTSMSVCLWVCLSVHTTCAIFTKFFVRVACVRGSVLWHVYDRSHCLSPGRGFLYHWKCIIGRERGMVVHSAGKVCYLRLPCLDLAALLVASGLFKWFTMVAHESEQIWKVETDQSITRSIQTSAWDIDAFTCITLVHQTLALNREPVILCSQLSVLTAYQISMKVLGCRFCLWTIMFPGQLIHEFCLVFVRHKCVTIVLVQNKVSIPTRIG